jgi:hypothetical protein
MTMRVRSTMVDESSLPVWQSLRGEVVVLDLASPFVYVGTLVDQRDECVLLEDVDAHDLRDTTTTREQYVLHCRQFGATPNRRQAWVSLREVVGISRLADVIVD